MCVASPPLLPPACVWTQKKKKEKKRTVLRISRTQVQSLGLVVRPRGLSMPFPHWLLGKRPPENAPRHPPVLRLRRPVTIPSMNSDGLRSSWKEDVVSTSPTILIVTLPFRLVFPFSFTVFNHFRRSALHISHVLILVDSSFTSNKPPALKHLFQTVNSGVPVFLWKKKERKKKQLQCVNIVHGILWILPIILPQERNK